MHNICTAGNSTPYNHDTQDYIYLYSYHLTVEIQGGAMNGEVYIFSQGNDMGDGERNGEESTS